MAVRMRVIALLLLVASPTSEAIAQVNIEQRRTQEEGFTLAADASVSVRSGNSDLFDIAFGTQLAHRSGLNSWLWIARLQYAENDGTRYASSAFTHLRYTRRLGKSAAGEAFGQLERDPFTLLQLRSLVGLGVRIAIADTLAIAAYYGSALMVEFENLDATKVTVHPAASEVLRWSNYLSFRWAISDKASISTTAYAQPILADFKDIRLLHEAALDVAVTDALTLRVTFRQRFDSRPPDAVKRHDLFVENGIRLRF